MIQGIKLSIWLILLFCVSLYGQSFNSGSTGADGDFNPPDQMPPGTERQGNCTMASPCTVTVPLPPDGIFNFRSVTVGSYVTVWFRRNAANTPVYILAQGDVVINGSINVGGESQRSDLVAALGGPGGFSGGLGGTPISLTRLGGAGIGPGGGGGGGGGSFGGVYGIPELLPLIGGSGGGGGNAGSTPGDNGGGGGGALLIASSGTIDLGSGSNNATILANGGFGCGGAGGGSGGAIRLIATTLRGSRPLSAIGGRGGQFCKTSGGGVGWIRLEAINSQYDTRRANPAPYFSHETGPVFPPVTPSVRIVSVAGMKAPEQPTSDVYTPDVTIRDVVNPVTIVVEADNVPSGTRARVAVSPQLGGGARIITDPFSLTGSPGQPKRGSVTVNLPTQSVGLISAVIDPVAPEPSSSDRK